MSESFEKYQPIESENLSEHDRKLEEQLTEIQLRYCDKLIQDSLSTGTPLSFGAVFEKKTSVYRDIRGAFAEAYPEDDLEQFDKKIDEFIGKLELAYNNNPDNWLFEIKHLLQALPGKQETDINNETGRERLGAFEISFPSNKQHKRLIGLKEEDEILELHVPKLYLNDETKLTPGNFKKSLALIAEAIVDKHPQTATVMGYSWLMDTPLAKRAGFTEVSIPEELKPEGYDDLGSSFWLQFIDKNGQIDNNKLDQFFVKGEAPYTPKLGYIPVIQFLSQYLPENRRGQIKLLEADSEWSQLQRKSLEELKGFDKIWEESNTDNIIANFDKMENTVMMFKDAGIYDELTTVFIDEKAANRSVNDLRLNKRINELRGKLDDLQKPRYKEKIVFIPPQTI